MIFDLYCIDGDFIPRNLLSNYQTCNIHIYLPSYRLATFDEAGKNHDLCTVRTNAIEEDKRPLAERYMYAGLSHLVWTSPPPPPKKKKRCPLTRIRNMQTKGNVWLVWHTFHHLRPKGGKLRFIMFI